MGEINKRIKKIRDKEGLSRTKFAELIGTTERKMQNVEQELQRVQDDLIERIIKKFPQYAYWLVTGLTIPSAGQISPDESEDNQQNKETGNQSDEQQHDNPNRIHNTGNNGRYHRSPNKEEKDEKRT